MLEQCIIYINEKKPFHALSALALTYDYTVLPILQCKLPQFQLPFVLKSRLCNF